MSWSSFSTEFHHSKRKLSTTDLSRWGSFTLWLSIFHTIRILTWRESSFSIWSEWIWHLNCTSPAMKKWSNPLAYGGAVTRIWNCSFYIHPICVHLYWLGRKNLRKSWTHWCWEADIRSTMFFKFLVNCWEISDGLTEWEGMDFICVWSSPFCNIRQSLWI